MVMKKLFLFISFLILTFGGIAIFRQNRSRSPVFAEGGIEVAYQQTPLFNVSNFAPGDSVTGRVTISSSANATQTVGLRVQIGKITDFFNAAKFSLKIKDVQTGAIIFGEDGRKKFSSMFLAFNEYPLFTIVPGQSKDLDLIISFDQNAGNAFQGKSLTFNFSLGFIGRRGR